MKKNVIHTILLLSLCSFLSTVYANQGPAGQSSEEVKEKIQAQKVAYFTHRLSLTPEEAQVFWALYNSYESERMQLNREMMKGSKSKDKKIDFSELSDKEALELLDKKVKLINRELKFHNDLLRTLSSQRVLLFYKTERDFHRRLIHMEMKFHNKGGKSKNGHAVSKKTGEAPCPAE